MALTAKQEKFAQCVADGMSQADAYRAAYSCAASKPETVQKRASELMSNLGIATRVRELTEYRAKYAMERSSMNLDHRIIDALYDIFANTEEAEIFCNKAVSNELSKMKDGVAKLYGRKIQGSTRYAVLHRAGFKCQACGSMPSLENDIILAIDHILPYSLGGSNKEENLQVLCAACNSSKSNLFDFNHNDN